MNLDFDVVVPDAYGQGTALPSVSPSLSQRPSWKHPLQAQQEDLGSWFLVSDDEGDDEKYHKSPSRSKVGVEDLSPIPVRSPSSARKHDTVKTHPESGTMPKHSHSKVGVQLSERRSDSMHLQPHAIMVGWFASNSRCSMSLAHSSRFSTKAKTWYEAKPRAFLSSNLSANNESIKATLNLGTDDYKHHDENCDSSTSHLLESSGSHKANSSVVSDADCESFLKHVTFSPSNQNNCTSYMTNQSSTSSSSRLQRRPRARSQSIAIKKRVYPFSSTTTQEEPDVEDSISYNERLYDNATWRMYHRIVDHRRSQLLQQRGQNDYEDEMVESRDVSVRPVTQPRYASTSESNMMLFNAEYGPYHHAKSTASGNSSIASSNVVDDDDEIFEMEL